MRQKAKAEKPNLAGRGSPTPNQVILGKRRGQWVRDCALALVASTEPSGRFLLMRGGFYLFQERTRTQFKNHVNLNLTSDELRWIYDYVARYMMRGLCRVGGRLVREKDLQRHFEKQYQKELRLNLTPDVEELPGDGSDIVAEDKFGRILRPDGRAH